MSDHLIKKMWESGLPSHLKPLASVMLAYGDGHGRSIFPSLQNLASKCLGTTLRSVQLHVGELRRLGVFVPVADRRCTAEGIWARRAFQVNADGNPRGGSGWRVEYQFKAGNLPVPGVDEQRNTVRCCRKANSEIRSAKQRSQKQKTAKPDTENSEAQFARSDSTDPRSTDPREDPRGKRPQPARANSTRVPIPPQLRQEWIQKNGNTTHVDDFIHRVDAKWRDYTGAITDDNWYWWKQRWKEEHSASNARSIANRSAHQQAQAMLKQLN